MTLDRYLTRSKISNATMRAARYLNPIAGAPSAALETAAFIDSFGSSLMPRTSTLQGASAGLSVVAARVIGSTVEAGTRVLVSSSAPLPLQLGVRAVTASAGEALMRMPSNEDETLWPATARSGGQLLRGAAIGGAIYDIGRYLTRRYPSSGAVRPAVMTSLALAGFLYWAQRRLEARKTEIQRWPIPQENTLAAGLAAGTAVSVASSGAGKAYLASRNAWIGYLGPGVTKNVLARAVNGAMWWFGLSSLYNAGVGYVGRANEKIDPGYSEPPDNPLVSGSPESLLPFEDLGQQGRRYVTDALTPEYIESVMGEPAVGSPIRTYVGFNSEPIYQTGRAELALAELDRTGAFDRSYLLLVSPTGTGWVDHTMIEAAELFTRGDMATCCIQYGRFPSFLSLQKVALGRRQFRLLLWGVKQRLRERAPEDRPKVFVFGESLGAWASSDTVMYSGIEGFDHYGIDRALWFGLPGLAKWSRNGMARGSSDLVPEGTVGVFDHPDQLVTLSEEEKDRLRAVILSHDNDPIAQLVPDIAVKKPDWLADDTRGRNVPDSMSWVPIITLVQTMIDAANAMVTVPGQFLSFGHDYRADTARMVLDGYRLPAVTDDQMDAVEAALRELELERSARIKAPQADEAPPAPAQREDGHRRRIGGVPLVEKRTRGARWRRPKVTPAGDVQ